MSGEGSGNDANPHPERKAGAPVIIVAFLVGGVAGLLGAAGTLLFTDLGWGMALAAYFTVGYGLPLAVLAATSVTKPQRADLQATDNMVRR